MISVVGHRAVLSAGVPSFRFADNPGTNPNNQVKIISLGRGWGLPPEVPSRFDDYLSLSGALRCSSSIKFSRKMTWPEFCWVEA
jgi:hypothetical protein